jgi:ATP-dependent DNA helicase RecQ
LDRIPTYGKLASLPLAYVKDLLGVLADAGLIERQGIPGARAGAFVLALTAEGRAVAKGTVRPELDLPARAGRRARATPRVRADEPDGSDADPDLLARLKSWRTEQARRRSVPPYVVFHDRTLAAIAAARPAHADDLSRIKGIGPAKLEAYGEELLRLLR